MRASRGTTLSALLVGLALFGCSSSTPTTPSNGCRPTDTLCDGACADLASDPAHCGACGAACRAGETCSKGACVPSCGEGLAQCGARCRDLTVDPASCGACDHACKPGQTCAAGACADGPRVCGALGACSDGCHDFAIDPHDCGSCGHACGDGQFCVAGACAADCPKPFAVCGSSCVDLDSNTGFCGACDRSCDYVTQRCRGGTCSDRCGLGQTACPVDGDIQCHDLKTDHENCGECDKACAATQVCVDGKCQCAYGGITCGGVCVDPLRDPRNCGGCGTTGCLGCDTGLCMKAPLDVVAGTAHVCAAMGGVVACWGRSDSGQAGVLATAVVRPHAVLAHTYLPRAAAARSCVDTDAGGTYCFGDDSGYALGIGPPLSSSAIPVPSLVPHRYASMSMWLGPRHSCGQAIASDGVVNLSCWGRAGYALGFDPLTGGIDGYPHEVSRTLIPSAMALGVEHTCAIILSDTTLAKDTVACWGRAEQLGDGSTSDRFTPGAVAGLGVASEIVAGDFHTCALAPDGKVRCWGGNDDGQLGDGTTTAAATPVLVKTSVTFAHLYAHQNVTCGLTSAGDLHCWGKQAILGLTPARLLVPTKLDAFSGFATLAIGDDFLCALTLGKIRCAGDNTYGQLGDGTTTSSVTPVDVVF